MVSRGCAVPFAVVTIFFFRNNFEIRSVFICVCNVQCMLFGVSFDLPENCRCNDTSNHRQPITLALKSFKHLNSFCFCCVNWMYVIVISLCVRRSKCMCAFFPPVRFSFVGLAFCFCHDVHNVCTINDIPKAINGADGSTLKCAHFHR